MLQVVDLLTSQAFGREKRFMIKDDWTSDSVDYYGADYDLVEDSGTSHTNVIAPNGDAVAVTSTINAVFGSGKGGKAEI